MSGTLGFHLPAADAQRLAILVKEFTDIVGRMMAKPGGSSVTPASVSTKPARIAPLVAAPAPASVTLGEVQQAYRALGQVKGGAVAILNVLGNFRVCHLGDATPDQYAALAGAFNDALAALGGPPRRRRQKPK